MTYACFRTSQTFHVERPRRRSSAQIAWDILARDGEIVSMRLLDGLWMCKRPNGELDEIDAAYVRQKFTEATR